MLRLVRLEEEEITEDMRRKVIVAAVGYYRLHDCPLGIGVNHDDQYTLLGIPLRRSTPLELRKRWPGIVSQVHEDLMDEDAGELAEAA